MPGQDPRLALSASSAKSNKTLKNSLLCPLNRPDLVKPVAAATAPAFAVEVGRITEHNGSLVLMNLQGRGMI